MSQSDSFDSGKGVTRGDVFPWRRRFTNLKGDYVIAARLTFKTSTAVADPGTLQKTISNISNSDGVIEDTGQTSGITVVRFDFSAADTLLFTAGTEYVWDLELSTDGGQVITQLAGTVVWSEQVTVTSPTW